VDPDPDSQSGSRIHRQENELKTLLFSTFFNFLTKRSVVDPDLALDPDSMIFVDPNQQNCVTEGLNFVQYCANATSKFLDRNTIREFCCPIRLCSTWLTVPYEVAHKSTTRTAVAPVSYSTVLKKGRLTKEFSF
jgi:hypothetical protein